VLEQANSLPAECRAARNNKTQAHGKPIHQPHTVLVWVYWQQLQRLTNEIQLATRLTTFC